MIYTACLLSLKLLDFWSNNQDLWKHLKETTRPNNEQLGVQPMKHHVLRAIFHVTLARRLPESNTLNIIVQFYSCYG